MSGIWSMTDGVWRAEPSVRFAQEKELHDLVERTPGMLPLAGAPRVVVLGREVHCGSGWADLVAVEVDTGRPVVIEIKLVTNVDRRQVLTQVLGYAAFLRRLDGAGFEDLLARHLGAQGHGSVAAAVEAGSQSLGLEAAAFADRLNDALVDGRLRCVIVIDQAPPDLVELVGYLQEVTNDRLSLDLITVTAYDIDGRRILVPQLVEPDRSQVTAAAAGRSSPSAAPTIVKGSEAFAGSIDTAPAEDRARLRSLLAWAESLESNGLAVVYTSTGKGRWVLNPRLPGQERGMIVVWNDKGPYLSPYRTVLEQEAPKTLQELDRAVPGQIGQGNYIKAEYTDELLGLLRNAYEEAARRRASQQAMSP
jgi:hypothetical protein